MKESRNYRGRKLNLVLIMITCSTLASLLVAYVINKMNETNAAAEVEAIVGIDYWSPIWITFVFISVFVYFINSVTCSDSR